MQVKHATGQHAGAVKYDILSALLVLAAQGESAKARLALRLSLLITTRYNWRVGTFCVGQREIARMWGVTERTAKRELAQLRTLGWIVVHRPAARGRVAEHRIDMPQVLAATRAYWPEIGSDFVARMEGPQDTTPISNVVPLHAVKAVTPPRDGTLWAEAAQILATDHPATYAAWFAKLAQLETENGVLILGARSRFVADYVQQHLISRVMAAAVRIDPTLRQVQVVVTG